MIQWHYLVIYALGSLLPFFLVFYLNRVIWRSAAGASALYAMGASFSNSLMLGFPIARQLFGDAALIPLAMTLMVENFIMMPLALAMAEADSLQGARRFTLVLGTLKRVLTNPIILAILLGVAASLAGVELPLAAERVIDLFSSTVSGVALFAIGGMLAGPGRRGSYDQVATVLPVKLLLHPLTVALLAYLWPGLDPKMALVAVVLASMPMFGVYPIIGARYGMGEDCASILIPTTIGSFFSINLVLWLMGL